MKISPQKKINHKIQIRNNQQKQLCRRMESLLSFPRQPNVINKKLTAKQIQEKCSQLHKQAQILKQRRQELLQKHSINKQKQELKECTFKPKLNQNLQYHIPPSSFLKRQREWVEQKTKKLESRRKQISLEQIEQCTFQPSKSKSKSKINIFKSNIQKKTMSVFKSKIEGGVTPRKIPKQNSYAKIFRDTFNKNEITPPLLLNNLKNDQEQEKQVQHSTRRDEKESTQRFQDNKKQKIEQQQ